MTNTRRNTIVLSSLLLFVVVFTLIQIRSNNKKKDEVEKLNSLLLGQIAVLDNQISNIDSLKREYTLQQELIAQQSKLLINQDNPTITYRYLLQLLNWMRRDIIFDFSQTSTSKSGQDFNEYLISGKTHFANLVALVNNMEHQRALLTVEELSIGNDNIADSDTVSFSMVFRTHYKPGGADPSTIQPKQITSVAASHMLFKSRIFEQARTQEEGSRLVNLDNVTLIGLSEDRVFLRDTQGIIRILSVGNRVNHGYLKAIDVSEEKAVFIIDLYGITEEKTLFIRRN